jgi:hypothetical protein
MIGVEVRHAEMADAPFAALAVELEHRVQIRGMPVLPPVKLQQGDPRETEAVETLLHALGNDLRCHRPREWAPLGERGRVPAAGAREVAADEQLRAAVVVRHVEGVESRVGVLAQCLAGGIRVERRAVALHVGDLPEADEHARHLEPGCERDARRTTRSVNH